MTKKKLKGILKNKAIAIFIIAVLLVGFTLFVIKMVDNIPSGNPKVKLETNLGDIVIELYPDRAPITVNNFLEYVRAGHYDGTVFHRVIKGFMIQGGGFDKEGYEKKTRAPIKLESDNGLKNNIGTIAMARTSVPNSATSQFFINVKDNDFLNYAPGNPGYAVFGKVTKGMEVVKDIEDTATTTKNGMADWPVKEVVINKAKIIS